MAVKKAHGKGQDARFVSRPRLPVIDLAFAVTDTGFVTLAGNYSKNK